MQPEIQLTLPPGWSMDDAADPELIACRPDNGPGELMISNPWFALALRDLEATKIQQVFTEFLDNHLGRVLAAAYVPLSYSPAVRAEVERAGFEETTAWLVVPSEAAPLREFVLITWHTEVAEHGQTAHEIVASLRPSRRIEFIELGIRRATQGILNAGFKPIAMLLDAKGEITELALGALPCELWDDACRLARAERDATAVAQITVFGDKQEYACVYVESATRAEEVMVLRDGPPMGATVLDRRDFFAAPSTAAVRALEAHVPRYGP